ncbi:MAG: hypothetical protein HFI93_05840 [Lachnospiraceae bacterium]|nr:hypothetical protein [Lachnospiraceae bacterium]
MKTHSIYIVLSQTGTYPSRLIRFYTREPYAHASIALDPELKEMYSFARRGLYNPLNAGFVEEHIDSGVFGRCKNTRCSVFELKINDEQYTRLRKQIDLFKENRELCSYNFLGIFGVIFHIPVDREFTYFCSQFVAELLKRSHVRILNKNSALVRPMDFRTNPYLTRIYTGPLSLYRATISHGQTELQAG